ncbi:GTPase HflX [Sulfuriferula sp. AH1]|uniref:GTPase HflX n=1 Tax=Sulfuriferula sp. AH1 TaxID=1985873 RepID=UPI000B3B853E|nr:GTPase HflX [Sulfuriferula sp. AH1]ARU31241.1 GTPase HflX [Sulfuriferula sp. AH1]
MFERHSGNERVVLASMDFGEPDYRDSVEELHRLAESAGLTVVNLIEGRRARPDPALFAGSGKVEEIAAMVQATEAGVVIFNHALSPAQERNLEQALQCRVVDRTTLILDIFASRAKSAEGILQVELAQLAHIATRLVRGWTHLERQKGGIGLRGPGETQLETDRRLIGKRVKLLKERLAKLHRQRTIQRRARNRGRVMSISLVGYTNAGKSTLFNALTNAGSYAADQLFATLDTTTRQLYLPEVGEIVLSDTVGFITRLPHTLVESFRATLEETIQADLLLHVVDAASPMRDKHINEVNKVLNEIGAANVPQILVMNKIDLCSSLPGIERDEYDKITAIRLSAKTGLGINTLREALTEAKMHFMQPLPDIVQTNIINNEYHPELD